MRNWTVDPALEGAAAVTFGSLDAVFSCTGTQVAQDPLSRVLRVELDGQRYYVKRYQGNGKNRRRRWFGLRQWLHRPRVRTEWDNLLAFKAWGIPTAELVAYGLERRWGGFRRGALITREIPDAIDLSRLAHDNDPRLQDRAWMDCVMGQIARITRTLHDHGFAHNDLKWRNLLVSGDTLPKVYLIDCPSGAYWRGVFLRYRIIKDLACLDKIGKYRLSRTQRLRFYLDYAGQPRLRAQDKAALRRITGFFSGRE